MATLIKNGTVQNDQWVTMTKKDELSPETIRPYSILPMSFWIEHRDKLEQVSPLGILVGSDQEIEAVADALDRFEVIAVDFPKFADGRGYSTARLLRDRYGYQGEIRAVGDVLQDQLFYMARCGFDAFQLREDQDIEGSIKSLSVFSEVYQDAADHRLPLFRRRAGAH